MEEQFNTQENQEQTSSFSFVTEEEAAQGIAAQEVQQPQEPQQVEEPQQVQEQPQEVVENDNQYSSEEVESAVFNFISERLGREVRSFDDLNNQSEQRQLDERISVIADFVEKTGRDPRDWFVYQSMNPSEMDDMTAISVKMASDYPNLSQDEVKTLLSSKYKLDPDLHGEDEVKLSQLQMKIDAENARKGIEEIRNNYAAPEFEDQSSESIIDDNWISSMRGELDTLDGVEFDLGNGQTFSFGIDDKYRNELAEKNIRLDEYFDPYVREDGSWDFDMLNSHRTIIDNIDSIVQSVYRQGMSDGQRGLVDKAANVQAQSPNQGSTQEPDQLTEQLRQALGGQNLMTFL